MDYLRKLTGIYDNYTRLKTIRQQQLLDESKIDSVLTTAPCQTEVLELLFMIRATNRAHAVEYNDLGIVDSFDTMLKHLGEYQVINDRLLTTDNICETVRLLTDKQ